MKTWKIVSGIISIVLSGVVVYQSRAASLLDQIANNLFDVGSKSGTAGYLVALLMVAGGIISIATRKGSKVGDIAIASCFGLAAVIGYIMGGFYLDLIVWSTWCVVCALFAIISLIKKTETAPASKPVPKKAFDYTSRDMARAEVMTVYTKQFRFDGGEPEQTCRSLFGRVEVALPSDSQVVTAFMAKEGSKLCACAVAVSKFIVANEQETTSIPILNISNCSFTNGLLSVIYDGKFLALTISNPQVFEVFRSSLEDCQAAAREEAKAGGQA